MSSDNATDSPAIDENPLKDINVSGKPEVQIFNNYTSTAIEYKPNESINNSYIYLPVDYSTDGYNLLRIGKIKENNEYIEKEVVLGKLCTITETASYDDGTRYVKILYVEGEHLNELWVSEHDISNRKGLMEVSSRGCTFKENNINAVIDYFTQTMIQNKSINHSHITSKTGWKDNYKTFVIGKITVSAIGKNYAFKNEDVAESLKPVGSLERVVEAINYVIDDPVVQTIFCAAYASPQVDYVRGKPFTVNLSVDSGSGKTLAEELAALGIGCPIINHANSLFKAGDSTLAAFEEIYSDYDGLPIFIDENSLNEDNNGKKGKDNLQKLRVYKHSIGTSKNRSKMYCTDKYSWGNVELTSGEHVTFDENTNIGQMVRSIEIMIPMRLNIDGVKKYKEIVELEENWGHIMPLYIKKTMELGREECIRLFEKYIEVFLPDKTNISMARIAKNLALMALAGHILNMVFRDIGVHEMSFIGSIKESTQKYLDSDPSKPEYLKLAEAFHEHFSMSFKKYNEPEDIAYNAGQGMVEYRTQKTEFYGYYDEDYIEVFPEIFKREMVKMGFNEKSCKPTIAQWAKKGVVETQSGKNTFVKKVNGKSVRVYKIVRSKFDEMIGLPVDSTRAESDDGTKYESIIGAPSDYERMEEYNATHPDNTYSNIGLFLEDYPGGSIAIK